MSSEVDAITFDFDTTRRNFDNNETLIWEIGAIFIEDVPVLAEQLRSIAKAVRDHQSGDSILDSTSRSPFSSVSSLGHDAKRLAHNLKGLGATFGAQPLVTFAQEVESMPWARVLDGEVCRLEELSNIADRTVLALSDCVKAGKAISS